MPSQRRAFAHCIFVFLLITAVVGIVGCGHRNAPAPVAQADLAAANAHIAQPAWLGERLPAHTVVYARIPSFWGLLSAPDGRPLDPVLASAEHIKIIASLRDAVRRNKLIADTRAAPVLGLLLGDQGAPLEIALIDISDQPTPAGNLLLTTRLDVPDIATLNAHANELAGDAPFLKAPFDANGSAELEKDGFLQFDLATHRLYAFIGTGATRMGLDDTLKQLTSTRSHPMQDAEREIDNSGQGLFVWINLKGLATLIPAQMPLVQPGTLAFGWGTVAGHGRMQLLLYAPDARLLGYLAPDQIDANLRTAGKPNWIATLALPSAGQLQAIENNLDQDYGAGTQQKYRDAMAKAKDRLGFVPMDFARTIGPDLLAFSDANGRFYALRVRDRAAFYTQLDQLGKRFDWRSAVTHSQDVEIHQLTIPGATPPAPQPGTDPHTNAWWRMFARLGNHFYWIEDGHYLVFASVPQLLVDRAASKPDTSLGDWLRDTQSGHGSGTLLGFGGTSKNAQRDMYYTYLSMLQALGDVLGKPVDLMPMPASNGLHLPVDGVYSASISVTKSRVGFSLSYEQSPAELVTNGAGGTYGTVAVVAILAAIAIPAYQDYVIRAQVSEGPSLASGAKVAVSEYRLNTGHMPADNAAAGLAPAVSISGAYVTEVLVNDGEIRVTYSSHAPQKANAQLDGGVLVFSPTVESGAVQWTCASANIPPKYLPSVCRQ
jgi:Tfp pilus assembly major pilin PilA